MCTQESNSQALAHALFASAHPVFVTGAGLSAASGLATYRQGPGAVWHRFITELGTTRAFFADPLQWWTQFWLQAHPPEALAQARPNAGHLALMQLLERLPNALIITQNIDQLHLLAGTDPQRVIEIHGRAGLYRCISGSCERFYEPLTELDLDAVRAGQLPRCDRCGDLLRPLVLLFDEMYLSHPFFQSKRAHAALEQADLMVFVGTSFSVGITLNAVNAGQRRRVPMYNINLEASSQLIDVLGPSEEVLQTLLADFLAQLP